MRQIGTLADKDDAKRLADYLLTLGITTRVDERPSGCQVWVHHEDKVERAKREFEEFQKEPSNPRYEGVEQTARTLRKKKQEEDRKHIRNSIALRGFWDYRSPESVPVTLLLLVGCVLVCVFTYATPKAGSVTDTLSIAPFQSEVSRPARPEAEPHEETSTGPVLGADGTRGGDLSRIRRGEVWRLVTPIFLHFTPIHLLFCLYWLNDIGGMIELRRGTLWLIGLVLLIAIPSNLAQYAVRGPRFGGMLPVILGLFAFVWVQRRYLPSANLPLRANTEVILGIGFLASVFGFFVGSPSGVAGIIGFAVGLLLGAVPVVRRRLAGRS